jgi:hypothetical protein
MPEWLAVLTVSMFDGQAKDAAMTWAARFGAQMARWHRLDDAAWLRVRESFCSACVEEKTTSDAADSLFGAFSAADAAANAARWAADAAAANDAAAYPAARQACWTRLATAMCDLIDAELAALAAKENEK